jgi:hypothetical protein
MTDFVDFYLVYFDSVAGIFGLFGTDFVGGRGINEA